MFNFKCGNKGFTLLEIILAIAVVSIIGVTFFAFFANSAKIIKSTDVREKALMLAQQEMEVLRADGFKEIKNKIESSDFDKDSDDDKWNSNDNYDPSVSEDDLSAEDGFPKYNFEIEVKEKKDGLYKLIVTSKWNENSAEKSIDLTTYVSSRGD